MKLSNMFPKTGVYEIGPEEAEALLESSKGNRAETGSERIAEHIRKGTFVFNGESIIVDDDWSLRDGHNRCKAVISANKPITSVVVIGVPSEIDGFDVQHSMDNGNNRTFTQSLQMEKVKDAKSKATVTKAVYMNPLNGYRPTAPKVSNIVLMDFFRKHQTDLEKVSLWTSRIITATGAPASPTASFVWQALKNRPDDVEKFVRDLSDLTHGGVVAAARKRMWDLGSSGDKPVRWETYRHLRFAWDQSRRGYKNLRMPEDSAELPEW